MYTSEKFADGKVSNDDGGINGIFKPFGSGSESGPGSDTQPTSPIVLHIKLQEVQ